MGGIGLYNSRPHFLVRNGEMARKFCLQNRDQLVAVRAFRTFGNGHRIFNGELAQFPCGSDESGGSFTGRIVMKLTSD